MKTAEEIRAELEADVEAGHEKLKAAGNAFNVAYKAVTDARHDLKELEAKLSIARLDIEDAHFKMDRATARKEGFDLARPLLAERKETA